MTATEPSGVTFAERAVYLEDAAALVLADLHAGRDATSNVSLPLGERADLRDRLAALLDRFDPAEVVIAGDLLHAFDEVPADVPETVTALAASVAEAGASLTVTPGNHDGLLDAVLDAAETGGGETAAVGQAEEYRLAGDAVVTHGHEVPTTTADLYVVGHEHPAIEIEGVRRPCFLFGERTEGDADVLVVPAFSRLAAGTRVGSLRRGAALSPLLSEPAEFRPIVAAAEETLAFPPLGELRGVL